MLTQADHDFITDLRERGCAVLVYTPDEVAQTGADRWELEARMMEAVSDIIDRWSHEHDFELDPEELQAKHGDEHPSYPVIAYVLEPTPNPEGYWGWVYSQLHGVG